MAGARPEAVARRQPVRGVAVTAARESAVAAAVAAAVVMVAVAAMAPLGVHAQPGPPASPFPPALTAVLFSGSPVGANAAITAPFEFRLNAGVLVPVFDCVGVYAANADERRYTGWDGRALRRAPTSNRTDDALGVCAASVAAAVTDHLYGAYGSAAMYAATAAAGFNLPRLNDTTRCSRCNDRPDPVEPACVGLSAARHYISTHLLRDGMNQDGRAGLPPGAPPRPYADTVSGYRPVNGPAAGVTALTRWVPLEEDLAGLGTYTVQAVTAAHTGLAAPVMANASRLRRLRLPPPYRSPGAYGSAFRCGTGVPDPDGLCGLAWGALAQAPRLDARRRALIRWFDRKSSSIGMLPAQLLIQTAMPLSDYLVVEMALNAFTWDATIAVWAEKVRHDAVRPASLIPAILRHTRDGAAFTSTIRTMPHGEYPSASAAICAGFSHIFAAAGGGALNLSIPLPAGYAAPDTPAMTLTFNDPGDMAAQCGQSRLWGGLHFADAVDAGSRLGVAVAKEVLRTVACRAPGTPWLPPCHQEGGGGAKGQADNATAEGEYVFV